MNRKTYRLKDICRIKSGKRIPLGMDFTTEVTSHPYIRARDIKGGRINTDDLIYLDDNVYEKIKKYIINHGDIAITVVGASVGDVSYAQEDVDGYNLTENAVRLTEFSSDVNGKYLYYILSLPQYRSYMQIVAGGAAQPKLGIYKVERIKVELPNRDIQDKVVKIMSNYDDLIENCNKRIRLLENIAENIYKEWFVRYRFPENEDVALENGLPRGWHEVKLEEVANISTGKCNRQDAEVAGEYPLFDRSMDIKRSSKWIKDCEAIIVPGEGTSFIPRYYVGKFNLHQRCYCVEPKFKGIGKFLFYTLLLNKNYFLSVATGATVPSLRQNNFTSFKFVMPTKELCERFESIVSNIFDLIDKLKEEVENLEKQREILLPRIMSGKLKV